MDRLVKKPDGSTLGRSEKSRRPFAIT